MRLLSIPTRSLRAKIILMSVLLAGISALSVACVSLYFEAQALRRSSDELQLGLLHGLARRSQEQLDHCQQELESLARALTQHRWGSHAQIAVAKALLEASAQLDQLDVYDREGVWIDRIQLGDAKADPPGDLLPEIRSQVLQDGQWLSEVRVGSGEQPSRQRWVLPLRASGKITGFISSAVSLAGIEQELHARAQEQLTGTAHALYIADLEGQVLAHTKGPQALRNALADPLFVELQAMDLKAGIGFARPHRADSNSGEDYLATALRMPSRPWLLIAKIPSDQAYAPLHELRRRLLLWSTGIAGATLLLAFIVAQRVSTPLSALTQMAQRLQRGRFDHTSLLRRKDELGELARAMNQAAKELQQQGGSRSKDTREDRFPASNRTLRKYPEEDSGPTS